MSHDIHFPRVLQDSARGSWSMSCAKFMLKQEGLEGEGDLTCVTYIFDVFLHGYKTQFWDCIGMQARPSPCEMMRNPLLLVMNKC